MEQSLSDALETLWMFLIVMAGVEDEDERTRLTATSIPSLLPCCVSGVALRQETGAGYTLVLQREGRQLSAIDTELVLAESIPRFEDAMGRGPMLISCAAGTPHGGLLPRSLVDLGVQSLAVVPIRTLHHLIGILLVGKGHGEGFTRQEASILQMLAERSAIAIENTRLQQALQRYAQRLQELVDERTAQLRRSEERQRVLLEINNTIIANLDRASLFHAITQALRHVLPFDRATLTLYEPGRDVLRVFALEGPFLPEQFGGIGTAVSRQGSHVGWVFEHRAPLLRRDLEQENQFPVEEKLLAEGIRSYIVVPLITKDKAFGTLNIGSLVPYQYGEEDAAFLVEVAKQVALAVDKRPR